MDYKELIDDVIYGNKESVDLKGKITLDLFDKHMMEKYNIETELDTNGWQFDFWNEFSLNGIKFMLHGSLYYGDYAFTKC